MGEFEVTEGIRTERQTSTVSISPLGLRAFIKIKSFLGYKEMKTMSSEEVMDELISNWYRNNKGLDSD